MIFKNPFFLALTISQLADIQNFIYLAKIDMPNIIEKEMKMTISSQH